MGHRRDPSGLQHVFSMERNVALLDSIGSILSSGPEAKLFFAASWSVVWCNCLLPSRLCAMVATGIDLRQRKKDMRIFTQTLTAAWSLWLLTIVAVFAWPKQVTAICGPVTLKLFTA